MNYMKKRIVEIFKNNLEYVYYARSGIVYHTNDVEAIAYLSNKGWKYNKIDSISPPVVTICDIVDCDKIMQYENVQFNLAYYLFLTKLKTNNKLENFIKGILCKKDIYYKDFYYHISNGPILENSIRIKGIDKRIETLKIDLAKSFIKSEQYSYYMGLVKDMMGDFEVVNLPLKEKRESNEVDKYYEWLTYINKFIYNNINILKNKFEINKEIIENLNYDVVLFIPNGGYKYLDIFVDNSNLKKVSFYKIHADNDNRGEHIINDLEGKNKKVLIIDSAFSGRTLQIAKQYIQRNGGVPIVLGIYPKSRNIINIMDYALIGNKIYSKENLQINDENMFIDIYINNLKGM